MSLPRTDYVYRHDLDPFLVEFPEGVRETIGLAGLRWYGMAYLAGFIAGYLLLRWLIDRNYVRLSREQAVDFVLTVALYGVIGGRLGYVILYGLEFWMHDPFYVFKVWQGGMSIHGGLVGAILGIAQFSRRIERPFLELSDAAAFGTPPGLFFGRIANFINGELWGRPTDGDWGVIFPQASGEGVPRHPSQLYEALLEGPVLFIILYWIMTRSERNGMVSVGFLAGYGALRFFVEFYRAPDPHLGYELLGMTRGQEYSLITIAIALAIYWFMVRPNET